MGSAVNFDKLCRICTIELPEGVLIFSEIGKKLCLEAKLKKYLHISVSTEDNLPKVLCMNCCKKLDSIHKFASMAVKMQDKLKMLVETGSAEDMKEHSILHSILSKGSETDCEVTELEVRVDPMLFLCAFEDGSSDGEDLLNGNDTSRPPSDSPVKIETSEDSSSNTSPSTPPGTTASTTKAAATAAPTPTPTATTPTPSPSPSPSPPLSSSPTSIASAAVSTPAVAAVSACVTALPPASVALPQSTPQPAMPDKESKPYRCSVCSRGFFNEIGLQNHLWSHLPSDRRVLGNTTVGNSLERSVGEGRLAVTETHGLVLKEWHVRDTVLFYVHIVGILAFCLFDLQNMIQTFGAMFHRDNSESEL